MTPEHIAGLVAELASLTAELADISHHACFAQRTTAIREADPPALHQPQERINRCDALAEQARALADRAALYR